MGDFHQFVDRNLFPEHLFKELQYSETVYLSTTTLTSNFGTCVRYSLNGIFDPTIALGGHQPYGFDQICPILYLRYKVFNCRASITFSDPTADGLVVGAVIIPPGPTYSLTGKALDTIAEAPFSVVRRCNNTGSQLTWIHTGNMPIGSISGLTDDEFKAENSFYTGDANGNPTLQPEIQIAVSHSRADTPVHSIVATITLTYWTQFYERPPLPSS